MAPEYIPHIYGLRPVETISLGRTEIPEDVFREFLAEIRARFTMETYDLFTNNCNHFSNECSQFLLGKGIPERIVNLPQEVLSTPIGQMLRPVVDQMQRSMAGRGEASDPFSALSGGSGGGGVPPPAAPPSAPAAAVPTVTPSEELKKPARPVASSHVSTLKPFISQIRSASPRIREGDGPLSEEEAAALEPVAEWMAAGCSVASQPTRERLDSFLGFLRRAVLRWPGKTQTSVLFLLRLAVLSDVGARFFLEGEQGDDSGVDAVLLVAETVTNNAYSPLAATSAFAVLANLLTKPAGQRLAERHPETCYKGPSEAAMAILHRDVTEAGDPGSQPKPELRRIAATFLLNTILTMALSTPAEAASGAGESEGELLELPVQVLCAAVEWMESEDDASTLRLMLLILGRLLQRAPHHAPQLAASLGLGSALEDVAARSGVPNEVRALSAEVRVMVPEE